MACPLRRTAATPVHTSTGRAFIEVYQWYSIKLVSRLGSRSRSWTRATDVSEETSRDIITHRHITHTCLTHNARTPPRYRANILIVSTRAALQDQTNKGCVRWWDGGVATGADRESSSVVGGVPPRSVTPLRSGQRYHRIAGQLLGAVPPLVGCVPGRI